MNKLTPDLWAKVQEELKFSFSRSSGPGGQHVNRTESRVELRWRFLECSHLSDWQKNQLMKKLGSITNKDGELRIVSEASRSRLTNQKACIEKLRERIEAAFHKEKPRKKTKPTAASREKRLKSKRHHSEVKKSRRKVDDHN